MILTITFGIAGHELAHLMLSQYFYYEQSLPDQPILGLYSELATQIGPSFQKLLLPIISNSFSFQRFDITYVPAETFNNLLQRISTFLTNDLDIPVGSSDSDSGNEGTFLSGYIQSLNRIPPPEKGAATANAKEEGPAAWTKYLIVKDHQGKQEEKEEEGGETGENVPNAQKDKPNHHHSEF